MLDQSALNSVLNTGVTARETKTKEEPTDAELVLDTEVLSEEECVSRLTDAIFDYLEGGDTL